MEERLNDRMTIDFFLRDNVVNQLFEQAVTSPGLFEQDETTNRTTFHVHQLRKFFLSQISLKAPKEIAETLAGHSGYLTGSYRRYTEAQLAENTLKQNTS